MEWVKPEAPFVLLDIACTAWANAGRPTEPKGAVGFWARLFDEIARKYEADLSKKSVSGRKSALLLKGAFFIKGRLKP